MKSFDVDELLKKVKDGWDISPLQILEIAYDETYTPITNHFKRSIVKYRPSAYLIDMACIDTGYNKVAIDLKLLTGNPTSTETNCLHSWKTYESILNMQLNFDYCSKCDEKRV